MAEYIEKQAAIKELYETYEHEYPTASGAFDEYATRIIPNVLRNLPPADVRPVRRGRWKRVDPRSTVVTFRCSECNYYAHINATNFCPNCGADMREGDADG